MSAKVYGALERRGIDALIPAKAELTAKALSIRRQVRRHEVPCSALKQPRQASEMISLTPTRPLLEMLEEGAPTRLSSLAPA